MEKDKYSIAIQLIYLVIHFNVCEEIGVLVGLISLSVLIAQILKF